MIVRLELSRENPDTLIFSCDADLSEALGPLRHRPWAADDQKKLEGWADAYERTTELRKPDLLLDIGRALYGWLAPWWDEILQSGAAPLLLEVRAPQSPDARERALLEAPWELLANAEGHLAAQPFLSWGVYRRLGAPLKPPPLSDMALTTLFMAASPEGSDRLSFEAEETAILNAVQNVDLDLFVEETGTADELSARLARLRSDGPVDVLHLSCHGLDGDPPILALEDKLGRLAKTSPQDLAKALANQHQKIRLLFLSACLTARSREPLNAFGLQMLRRGTPAVLGWAGSVADRGATEFASLLYAALTRGISLEEAVAGVRTTVLDRPTPMKDWHLARLYLGPRGGGVLAKAKGATRRRRVPPAAFLNEQDRQVPVAGPDQFVGRRRELQTILRTYLDPTSTRRGVLIWGVGRQGKSSLAARVAQRLPDHPMVPIFKTYTALNILELTARFLKEKAWADTYRPAVSDDASALQTALEDLLARRRFLLLIDDLEQVLTEPQAGTPRLKTPGHRKALAAVLRAFRDTDTEARLLITSRYRFSSRRDDQNSGDDSEALVDSLLEVSLPALESYEARKQARAHGSDIEQQLADRCVAAALGNPGLLSLLLGMGPARREEGEKPTPAQRAAQQALESALVELEALRAQRAELSNAELLAFFEQIAVKKLLGLLAPGERDVLRLSACAEVPLPLAAARALGEVVVVAQPDEVAGRLLDFGLWEQHRDPVDPEAPAFLLNALVGLHLEAPGEGERRLVGGPLLETLRATWQPTAWGEHRPAAASYQLAMLALQEDRPEVLPITAFPAVSWLHRQERYRGAAALMKVCVLAMDAAGLAMEVDLLLWGFDLLHQAGEISVAEKCLVHLEAHLERDEVVAEPILIAQLLHRQAQFAQQRGEPEKALERLKRARALLPEEDVGNRAALTGEIAQIRSQQGDIEEALRLQQEKLKIVEALGDKRERAITLGNIAQIRMQQGDIEEALRLHNEELAVYEALGDKRSRAVTLGEIAQIRSQQGDIEEALRLHNEVLKIVEALGDKRSRAVTLGEIAQIRMQQGDPESALTLHQEKLAIQRQLNDADGIASASFDIAHILIARGQLDEALPLLAEAWFLVQRIQRADAIGAVGWTLAQVLLHQGELLSAYPILGRSLAAWRLLKQQAAAQPILQILADLQQQASQALQQAQSAGEQTKISMLSFHLGHIAAARGDAAGACAHLERSWQIDRALGDQAGAGVVGTLYAQALATSGERERAGAVIAEAIEALEAVGDAEGAAEARALRAALAGGA